MTHYTVKYGDLEGIPKQAKALADIVDYLGWEKFTELSGVLAEENPRLTLKQLRMALSFAGVQGYPVRAWYAHIYGQAALAEQTKAED